MTVQSIQREQTQFRAMMAQIQLDCTKQINSSVNSAVMISRFTNFQKSVEEQLQTKSQKLFEGRNEWQVRFNDLKQHQEQ